MKKLKISTNCKQKKDEIHTIIHPFKMTWSAESDWEPDDPSEVFQVLV